jgi:hypothetical protein
LEARELLAASAVTRSFQNGLLPSSAYLGTVDTKITGAYPTVDYGGAKTLYVDGTPDSAAMLKWDLQDIPTGSTVQAVSLTLNVSDASRDTYEMYDLKRDWTEGQATWQIAANGTNWQVAGVQGSLDRGTTLLGTVTAASKGTVTIQLNSAGVAVVQNWINNPSANHGFIIQDYAGNDGLEFASSENATAANRPKLNITYLSPGTTTPPATSANQAPVVAAGADRTIMITDTLSLNGTVSDDGLPNPPAKVTTTWNKVSGPGTITFGSTTAVDTTAKFSQAGAYELQLTASDGSLTSSDKLVVTVNSSTTTTNQAPVVAAGADRTILITDTLSLNGTVSDDGLPNPPAQVTTTWNKVSGPGTITFGSTTAVDTTAKFSQAGTYELQLTASDGSLTSSDKLVVTVSATSSTPAPAAVVRSYQNGTLPSGAYTGMVDTKITGTYPTVDYGGATTLYLDGSPDTSALLKWNLSDIPTGSTVQGVSLTLNVSDASSDTYEIYDLKRDWVEGQATWQIAANGTNWQVAGAQGSLDRGTTVLGTVTAASKGSVTIQLNSAGVAVVQNWINNPTTNRGFIIQDYAGNDGLEFASSENATVANRPKLNITYVPSGTTTPPPTSTNQAPTVAAGADRTILVTDTVNLDGTVTDDGLPNPPAKVTTTWTKVSGPGTVTFGSTSAVDTTAKFSQAGTYELQLTASDGSLSASDTMTITVTAPTTPVGTHVFYVSPNGSVSGDGSAAKPWDLKTALAQPAAVKPGDTIYVLGGTYHGNFVSTLTGTATAPITVQAAPGQHATIDIYTPGSTSDPYFHVKGDYTQFVGLEVMDSDPHSRVTTQDGSYPSDIKRGGMYNYGDYNKFINMVIHDMSVGLGMWADGKGGEVYGAIIYNNGWMAPSRSHGHGIYTQNAEGLKRLADNIIFNQFDYGIHAYGSNTSSLKHYLIEGNAVFNNGGAAGVGYRREPDILVGGATPVEDVTLKGNYTYQNGMDGVVDLGYAVANKDITLLDNYFVSQLRIRKGFTSFTASNNTVVGKSNSLVSLEVPAGVSTPGYQWNNNHYVSSATAPFIYKGTSETWSQWKSATGMDSQSDLTSGTPKGTEVFVEPNEYEEGRGNIIVYNWDKNPTAGIDLSSVLTVGAKYEIHNAMDFYGAPVLSGTYDGKPITLPMKSVTAPSPIGYTAAAPITVGPEFGTFVVTTVGSTTTAAAAAPAVALAAPAASSVSETTDASASQTSISPSVDVPTDAQPSVTTVEAVLDTTADAAGSTTDTTTDPAIPSETLLTETREYQWTGQADQIRTYVDQVLSQYSTSEKREELVQQIADRLQTTKITVTEAIDEAIQDLHDPATNLADDLYTLLDKLGDLHLQIGQPV